MTKEEKELLLKDLCARLPYNTLMNGKLSNNIGCDNIDFVLEPMLLASAIACGCKPYLRPLSSMTEEEMFNFRENGGTLTHYFKYDIDLNSLTVSAIVWFNVHHFDYRGLIEKGLALEASEGMYK